MLILFVCISNIINSGHGDPERQTYYVAYQDDDVTILHPFGLEEKILRGASTDVEKQALFASWFNNAKILAEVLYYDRDLERLVQQKSNQGQCGG